MSPAADAPGETNRRVLVIIPCLNEAAYIEDVIKTLIADARRIELGLVVADGGSTDGTRAIVVRLAAATPNIVLMDNPKRIQAAGVNSAVQKYGTGFGYLLRADAHAAYPKHFCETLLRVQDRTLADSVVVSMQTTGSTCFQRAAAAAQNSILGNGGAAHRSGATDRWVDHGHHALIKIDAFNVIGGYDETFSHNEDAEFDMRLTSNGGRIFHTSETHVTYFPRSSVAGLFRQYANIGLGRARNFLKHRKSAKLRHLVLVAVIPVLALMLLAPLNGIFALPGLAWILLCIGYGIVLGVRAGDPCAAAAGIAAMAMQAGWSSGFLRGLIGELLRSQGHAASDRQTSTI